MSGERLERSKSVWRRLVEPRVPGPKLPTSSPLSSHKLQTDNDVYPCVAKRPLENAGRPRGDESLLKRSGPFPGHDLLLKRKDKRQVGCPRNRGVAASTSLPLPIVLFYQSMTLVIRSHLFPELSPARFRRSVSSEQTEMTH